MGSWVSVVTKLPTSRSACTRASLLWEYRNLRLGLCLTTPLVSAKSSTRLSPTVRTSFSRNGPNVIVLAVVIGLLELVASCLESLHFEWAGLVLKDFSNPFYKFF